MKPDWDKLMEAFADSPTILIADVDCTTEGKSVCAANGVKGYPALKWGDPADLQDYKGGRDYKTLEAFANENLKPMCSPANVDLCEDDKKKEIEKFQAMDSEDLDTAIAAQEELQTKIEEDFKKTVEGLQKSYQDATEAKDKALDDIKDSGLGLMKAVRAASATAEAAAAKEEL